MSRQGKVLPAGRPRNETDSINKYSNVRWLLPAIPGIILYDERVAKKIFCYLNACIPSISLAFKKEEKRLEEGDVDTGEWDKRDRRIRSDMKMVVKVSLFPLLLKPLSTKKKRKPCCGWNTMSLLSKSPSRKIVKRKLESQSRNGIFGTVRASRKIIHWEKERESTGGGKKKKKQLAKHE